MSLPSFPSFCHDQIYARHVVSWLLGVNSARKEDDRMSRWYIDPKYEEAYELWNHRSLCRYARLDTHPSTCSSCSYPYTHLHTLTYISMHTLHTRLIFTHRSYAHEWGAWINDLPHHPPPTTCPALSRLVLPLLSLVKWVGLLGDHSRKVPDANFQRLEQGRKSNHINLYPLNFPIFPNCNELLRPDVENWSSKKKTRPQRDPNNFEPHHRPALPLCPLGQTKIFRFF